jgi:hypothetical protein
MVKQNIQELRNSYGNTHYIDVAIEDERISVIMELGMPCIDISCGYLADLISRRDQRIFDVLPLIEQQARHKELELLISQHMEELSKPVQAESSDPTY